MTTCEHVCARWLAVWGVSASMNPAMEEATPNRYAYTCVSLSLGCSILRSNTYPQVPSGIYLRLWETSWVQALVQSSLQLRLGHGSLSACSSRCPEMLSHGCLGPARRKACKTAGARNAEQLGKKCVCNCITKFFAAL